MKNNKFYRNNKQDEYYTPEILVNQIVKYLKEKNFKKILCPFDKKESKFVEILSNEFLVGYRHIDYRLDFFDISNEQFNEFDCIVSNPPFSRKLEIFKRLWEINKPFAILMNINILNYQEIGNFFVNHPGLQLLIFDKKVSFDGNTSSFNTSYFCKDILPKDLIFEHLEHNNTGKYFNKGK